MKRIYVKPPLAHHYLNNGVFRVNNGHNIFWNLDKELARKGIVIQTWDMDRNRDGDLYVYSDVPYPWELQIWRKTIATRERNILFCFESPIVNPFTHLQVVHHFFRRVYTWDDRLVDNVKYFKFFIPQLSEGLNSESVSFFNRKFLIFINAKKDVPPVFPLISPYKKNLYKERLRAVEYFSDNTPSEFDIYGRGWDKPMPWDFRERLFGVKKYVSYRGELKDNKLKTLLSYKFCLCFENVVAPGYITEKIFDCFKARCVPVYWGAPGVTEYIPENCFIDFRDFFDYAKLVSYLKTMTEKRYNAYIKAMDTFLGKPNTRSRWFEDSFKKIILNAFKD